MRKGGGGERERERERERKVGLALNIDSGEQLLHGVEGR